MIILLFINIGGTRLILIDQLLKTSLQTCKGYILNNGL